MNPLPPSAWAVGEAGECQTDDGELAPDLRPPFAPASKPDRLHAEVGEATPHEGAYADLLGEVLQGEPGAQGGDRSGGQRQEREEHGDADPVVQAALHVQVLPDRQGDGLIAYDRQPEGRVGWRQYRGQDGEFEDAKRLQQDRPSGPAEQDGQRQAHDQQSPYRRAILPDHGEVRGGRVAEEDECQRELGQDSQFLRTDAEPEEVQTRRPKGDATGHEHHRPTDWRRLGLPGDEPVEEDEGEQDGDGQVHGGHRSPSEQASWEVGLYTRR